MAEHRHIVAQRMRNPPTTTTVLVEHSAQCNVWPTTQCLLFDSGPEAAGHMLECVVQFHHWCGNACTSG